MYTVLNARPDFSLACLEVPAVEQFAGVVEPVPIPVRTDEEIMLDAEQRSNWDELEYFEYGTEGSISLRGLRNRFDRNFMYGKPSDVAMGLPGEFIKAIWESERQIPTVGEYAVVLGKNGLLNAEEVAAAGKVSRLEKGVGHTIYSARLEEDAYEEAIAAMDDDEKWLLDKVHGKLTYFVNLTSDAVIDDGRGKNIAKLAGDYASKRMNGSKDFKHHIQANNMLWEARGLSASEIKAMQDNKGHDKLIRYRSMGIPTGVAQQMVERPQSSFKRPLLDVDGAIDKALHGNLNTQLAVRKFFGTENLYELLGYQARADRLVAADVRANRAEAMRFNLAIARGDEAEIERMTAPREREQSPETVFELPIYSPEERKRFEALGSFAVHEPALKGVVAYFVEGAMMKHYRKWIDSQTEL